MKATGEDSGAEGMNGAISNGNEDLDDSLVQNVREHGQEQLLRHWPQLLPEQRKELIEDLRSVDFKEMAEIFKRATEPEESRVLITDRMETVDPSVCASVRTSTAEQLDSYRRTSLEAISRGEVGVLLLAGGQGTRLGVPFPKGMFDIGLPSAKTLYQIQAERILRLQDLAERQTGRADARVIMYIMTSEHTKARTEEFLKKNSYFGLDEANVVLFEQRMIPCFANDGTMILATKSKLARAPDGNGGLYWALRKENLTMDMRRRGVKYLHAYCVDNVLVKVADPVFVGYAIQNGADSANKVVEKAFPEEAVGVICKVDGVVQVVEYSEISKEKSELRDPDGRLTYRAGNICNHFFTTEFLSRVCDSCDHLLPYHVAKKKIPCADDPNPTQPNGVKLEKFVFDVFQFSRRFIVWECLREEEFSPLKNSDGAGKKDTPTTARNSLFALHSVYVHRAGGEVVQDTEEVVCEISPLVSYAGEDLEELVKGRQFRSPVSL